MSEQTFEQGWAARPFKEQFPKISQADAAYLDTLNKAITQLRMADLLTFTQTKVIREHKFPQVVSGVLTKYDKKLTV